MLHTIFYPQLTLQTSRGDVSSRQLGNCFIFITIESSIALSCNKSSIQSSGFIILPDQKSRVNKMILIILSQDRNGMSWANPHLRRASPWRWEPAWGWGSLPRSCSARPSTPPAASPAPPRSAPGSPARSLSQWGSWCPGMEKKVIMDGLIDAFLV